MVGGGKEKAWQKIHKNWHFSMYIHLLSTVFLTRTAKDDDQQGAGWAIFFCDNGDGQRTAAECGSFALGLTMSGIPGKAEAEPERPWNNECLEDWFVLGILC